MIHTDTAKIKYDLYKYRVEWYKKHTAWIIVAALVWLGLLAATYFCDFLGDFKAVVGGVITLIGVLAYGYINNKASAYAESKVFDK